MMKFLPYTIACHLLALQQAKALPAMGDSIGQVSHIQLAIVLSYWFESVYCESSLFCSFCENLKLVLSYAAISSSNCNFWYTLSLCCSSATTSNSFGYI